MRSHHPRTKKRARTWLANRENVTLRGRGERRRGEDAVGAREVVRGGRGERERVEVEAEESQGKDGVDGVWQEPPEGEQERVLLVFLVVEWARTTHLPHLSVSLSLSLRRGRCLAYGSAKLAVGVESFRLQTGRKAEGRRTRGRMEWLESRRRGKRHLSNPKDSSPAIYGGGVGQLIQH